MNPDTWLDAIPLWGIFLLTVAIVMAAIKVGTYLGNHRRKKPDHESEASLGTIIGSTLALLGFLLVFTFGIAAERFDERKGLLLEEINAIGTTHLRAGLLPEPHKTEVRKLLREYVDLRVNLEAKVTKPNQIRETEKKSEALQQEMWKQAEALSTSQRDAVSALFINSLNDLIDLHTSRLTIFMYRIPMIIWYVLYSSTVISMLAVGYQAGISGKKSFKNSIVLALTFTVVIMLVMDLDRAVSGTLRVSQKPMQQLRLKLKHTTELEPWLNE
ncbi:MAG: hypothetical protein BWY69_00911 [Planctomycetes bacterium ADurb.Bin401]|nr:MAG: hypothetical protein BWY69_00911 [Planctomycetes bacterium ADurb.Bin401]